MIDSPFRSCISKKGVYHAVESRLHAAVADRDAGQDGVRGTVAEWDQEGVDALVLPLAAVLGVGHIELRPYDTHDRSLGSCPNPVLNTVHDPKKKDTVSD